MTAPATPPSSPSPSFTGQTPNADRRRIVSVLVALVAVAMTAAIAMAATGMPAAGTVANGAPSPSANLKPHADPGGGRGLGRFGGVFGGIGRAGGVEITAIAGSSVSLKTVDGWTRTIDVTSSTEITKGGQTIAAGDLAVGDSIRLRQQRNADGTFTITRVDVVLPTVAGRVTAKTGSTITIEQRGGLSVTVHVGGSTKYRVDDVSGTADLDDVKVGMRIVAEGDQNSDGSLDAARILAGTGKLRGDHPRKDPPGTGPEASPGSSGSSD